MGMPLLVGAGIGAIGSAAMGKSPLTGALLGGALGGMGGAGGLFGAAPTAGVSGLSAAAPAAATAGEIAIPSTSLLEGAALPSVGIPTSAVSGGLTNLGMEGIGSSVIPSYGVQLSTAPSLGAMDYGIGAGNTLAGGQSIYQVPSFMDKVIKLPTQTMDYVKENPYQSANMALKANEALNPPPQQMPSAPVIPIQRGNFDPSSALLNVSPNLGMSKEEMLRSKAGQYANAAHLTDADRRKIGEFYTSLIG
jgi:hypothetical protein